MVGRPAAGRGITDTGEDGRRQGGISPAAGWWPAAVRVTDGQKFGSRWGFRVFFEIYRVFSLFRDI
jgi:hypothetical protein